MIIFRKKTIDNRERIPRKQELTDKDCLDIYNEELRKKSLLTAAREVELFTLLDQNSVDRDQVLAVIDQGELQYQQNVSLLDSLGLFLDPADRRLIVKFDRGKAAQVLQAGVFNKILSLQKKEALEQLFADKDFDLARNIKELIIESNLRLVIKVANNFLKRGLSKEDLISEGNIGLMRVVDRYRLNQGTRFSTYGVYWIRQAIIKGLSNQSSLIRIPIHKIHQIKQYRYALNYIQSAGEEISNNKIAEVMGVTKETVAGLSYVYSTTAGKMHSLSYFISEDGPNSLAEILADETADDPEQRFYDDQMKALAARLLHHIPSVRDREILKMRFGFIDGQEMTLESIGQQFGLTRERVRQIIAKSIYQLKRKTKNLDIHHRGVQQ